MNRILIGALALALATFTYAMAQTQGSRIQQSNAAEIQALQGVWKPVEALLGGAPLPEQVLNSITLKITGENYEVTVEGENGDKGTTRLDTGAIPKRIYITSLEGANKGKSFTAIYELKGADKLRVCYDLSGSGYPSKFESIKDTMLYLVTYERQKK